MYLYIFAVLDTELNKNSIPSVIPLGCCRLPGGKQRRGQISVITRATRPNVTWLKELRARCLLILVYGHLAFNTRDVRSCLDAHVLKEP